MIHATAIVSLEAEIGAGILQFRGMPRQQPRRLHFRRHVGQTKSHTLMFEELAPEGLAFEMGPETLARTLSLRARPQSEATTAFFLSA